ncbi:hypothetical protein OAS67_08765 [Alphaproteobacteria bacterium]|jgi:hypothetical protein|nr:hypothetical protein [Alphaproteobacteria bacterium]
MERRAYYGRKLWRGRLDANLSKANNAYGYLWCLNTGGSLWRDSANPPGVFTGKLLPKAPDNVFMALGARGKLMMVLPGHDMVVVSLGETQGTQARILALWDAIEMFLPS